MSIYVIGDLHLAKAVEKPMDIFGGWDRYMERIEENWKNNVKEDDTIVLAGDISWAMDMKQSIPDFQFIHELPGSKIILKGNHDYWWGSLTAMYRELEKHNIDSIQFLHNNSYIVDGVALCGSRGWMFETGEDHNEKIINREALRIEASLKDAPKDAEKILFLHYPPIYGEQELTEYISIMQEYDVKECYYGHIHGKGHAFAFEGERHGITFKMISADYIDFNPLKIR